MRTIAFATILCGLVTTGPLAAEGDLSVVHGQMRSAMAAVQSFRMQITAPGATGVATVMTKPMRLHMQMASGPLTIEMYSADGYLYQNIAKSGWKKQRLPDGAAVIDVQRALDGSTTFAPAADVVDGGVSYGALAMTIPVATIPGAPAGAPITLTCSYDKKTLLMHACSTPLATETFSGYNDPANDVTLPPDLASAVDAGPVLPVAPAAPSASPSAVSPAAH
jgi:hypothetical protein